MPKTVTSVDSFGGSYQVPLDQLKWRPGAYGIVIQDDKILLSPQFGENQYDLPGGGMEYGESPETAVIREVKEETGLDVANPQIIGVASSFFTFKYKDHDNHKQAIMLYYTCEVVGGSLSTEGFDEYEKEYAKLAEWVPLSKLDSIDVASSVDWRKYVKQANENLRH